jgi:hypothetical protein
MVLVAILGRRVRIKHRALNKVSADGAGVFVLRRVVSVHITTDLVEGHTLSEGAWGLRHHKTRLNGACLSRRLVVH